MSPKIEEVSAEELAKQCAAPVVELVQPPAYPRAPTEAQRAELVSGMRECAMGLLAAGVEPDERARLLREFAAEAVRAVMGPPAVV